jgi:hypothetical protein
MQDSLNLIKFKRSFPRKKLAKITFFACVGPQVLSTPAVAIEKHPLFALGGFINVARADIKPR